MSEVLIEGYAALNDVPDQVGDVICAGAFSASLARTRPLPMLLQHKRGAIAGRWVRMVEDGTGLFVRGLVTQKSAIALIERGMDGLSIGFRALDARPRIEGGRRLKRVELVEISLVAEPMQPGARIRVRSPLAVAA